MNKKYKHYTDEEGELIRNSYNPLTYMSLAIKMGRDPKSLRDKAQRMGLTPLCESKPGDRFGFLTLVRKERATGKKHRTVWYCICDCGVAPEKPILENALRSGNTKSCGCRKIKATKERNKTGRKEPGAVSRSKILGDYKHKARKDGQVFELTDSQFFDIVSKCCTYCGAEPRPFNVYLKANMEMQSVVGRVTQEAIDRSTIYANGIDRVDSNIGYIVENCVPCCKQCNYAKRDFSLDEFLNHIVRIYKHIYGTQ